MTKKPVLPQHRRHIQIYDEDWDWLTESYGVHSASKIGVSAAIRTIIHAKISQLKARINAKYDEGQHQFQEDEL